MCDILTRSWIRKIQSYIVMFGPRQRVNTSTRVYHVSSFCWLSFGRTMNTSLHRETHCGMHYERHCERVVAIVCYLKLKVVETQRWWCFELKGGPSPKQEGIGVFGCYSLRRLVGYEPNIKMRGEKGECLSRLGY
ncbi:hypothetical protein JHK82_022247 [Glycine max]|uniref:Uncharacterized protein n=1 Tax=Glycine max TaxID=3847 RepID=A0A0R0IRL1_SOYBN|nr:hypothetical protein JHK85_022737 [Glycine max]KAG5026360.1 hypothetical protein JHK86_022274 [Glycine max]KAG5137516.1 hypothetical protein JHK82_022247 [Glycine max]KAH1052798.1 hypothetical protein GYH30_022206 [Glycine max]KRH44912.1 hypothetical protein GLYMA_08G238700v4 [Glycine max]